MRFQCVWVIISQCTDIKHSAFSSCQIFQSFMSQFLSVSFVPYRNPVVIKLFVVATSAKCSNPNFVFYQIYFVCAEKRLMWIRCVQFLVRWLVCCNLRFSVTAFSIDARSVECRILSTLSRSLRCFYAYLVLLMSISWSQRLCCFGLQNSRDYD